MMNLISKARRVVRRRSPGGGGGLALALGVLAFTACEGENLFVEGRTSGVPEIRSFTAPAEIRGGDTLVIQLEARSGRNVREFNVALRGALVRDTVVAVEPPASPVEREIRIPLPAVLQDTLLTVEVTAVDTEDRASPARSETIRVVRGPRLEFLHPAAGQQVRSGLVLGIRLSAVDVEGISRLQVMAEGVIQETIVYEFSPARDTVLVDTAIAIPEGVTGSLSIRAVARNVLDETASTTPLQLSVVTGSVSDNEPPFLQVEVAGGRRLELTDSLSITVTARDAAGGSGIARIGLTALGVNGADTIVFRPKLQAVYSPPRTGTVVRSFGVSPIQFVDTLALPDTVIFQIHAYAVDAAGNCAAAVQNVEQRLPCDVFRSDTVASGTAGQRAEVVAVSGRSVRLPEGGLIADAVVDTVRQRIYLSNFSFNKVDILSLASMQFLPQVLVGSEPWGMALNLTEDTLFVANSGGTNVSYVSLEGTPAEDKDRRLFTPNTVLFEINEAVTQGRLKYTGTILDFSDRPMFLAQDSRGRLLYSTKPTGAAPDGSIRMVDENPRPELDGDSPEVRFLVVADAIDESAEDDIAILGVDSIRIFPGYFSGTQDAVVIYNHENGFPGSVDHVYHSDTLSVGQALAQMQALDPHVFFKRGKWIRSRVGLSDTTFVSASGNREVIAFGEGSSSPFGRIILWNSEAAGGMGRVSSTVEVIDLVNNAAERVHGVGMNLDGSLGVARGETGAYLFTGGNDPAGDLRLQGEFRSGLGTGGAGAAFHPLHDSARRADEYAVAFVGTSRRTLKAFNTFHFYELGEIHIRDNIVGPLRASLPLPSDNAGFGMNCSGPNCVIMKLYGITDSGSVVIVDVRRRDLVGASP